MSSQKLKSFYGGDLDELKVQLENVKHLSKEKTAEESSDKFLMAAMHHIVWWSKPDTNRSEIRNELKRLSKHLNKTAKFMAEDALLSEYLMLDGLESESPFSTPPLPFRNLPFLMKECADQADTLQQSLAKKGRPPEYFKKAFLSSLAQSYFSVFGKSPATGTCQ